MRLCVSGLCIFVISEFSSDVYAVPEGRSLLGVNRAYRFASYNESLVIFIDMFGWTDLKLGSNWLAGIVTYLCLCPFHNVGLVLCYS